MIGEAAFEIGALLLNPYPDLVTWPDLRKIQDQRIQILVESLELDQKRVRQWSFVRCVLSAIWSVEEGDFSQYAIEVARSIQPT